MRYPTSGNIHRVLIGLGETPAHIYLRRMTIPISAQIHREGKWFIAFCPEFPEANGQGETQEQCIESLKDAIELLLEDRREDARQNLPPNSQLVEIA
jgi:predicted RNase H-like HicB family nuclease